MHYLSKEDHEKSKRHEELTKQLTEVQAEHLKVYKDYYSGKASAEELIKVQEKLNQIQEDWRSTIVTLKRKQD